MKREYIYVAWYNKADGSRLISLHNSINGALSACERKADEVTGGKEWRNEVEWETNGAAKMLDFHYYSFEAEQNEVQL